MKTVSPVVTAARRPPRYEGASHTIGQLVGTYPSYFEASNKPVAKGAYFTTDDVLASRKVVGDRHHRGRGRCSATVDPVGKQITISGVPFTVVGVLEETGTPASRTPTTS